MITILQTTKFLIFDYHLFSVYRRLLLVFLSFEHNQRYKHQLKQYNEYISRTILTFDRPKFKQNKMY